MSSYGEHHVGLKSKQMGVQLKSHDIAELLGDFFHDMIRSPNVLIKMMISGGH